jgi:uncharacterized membrane protein (DUF4010 family)
VHGSPGPRLPLRVCIGHWPIDRAGAGLAPAWRAPGSRAAGIRTFAISGLLGGLIAALAQAGGGAATVGGALLLGLAFATYGVVITLFGREENVSIGAFSATTAVAGMLTFARLSPETLSRAQAAVAILAAVASDTVSKVAIGAAIGRGWFAGDLAAMAVGCLAVGAAVAWATLAPLPSS